MMFKLQPPQDIISRMFILEYLREIDRNLLYEKANKHQKKDLFYKFIDDEDNTAVDINWEFCTFEATLYQLDSFASLFLKEIEEIENKRKDFYDKQIEERIAFEQSQPTDINVMDLANTEIEKNKTVGLVK